MFESFSFVSGVFFGLAMGGFVGMVVMMLLNMGHDNINEILIDAAHQLPVGYYITLFVYLGQIRIRVRDEYDNDIGYVDNPDMELDARLLLAQAHAENYERQHLEEIIQDQVAA